MGEPADGNGADEVGGLCGRFGEAGIAKETVLSYHLIWLQDGDTGYSGGGGRTLCSICMPSVEGIHNGPTTSQRCKGNVIEAFGQRVFNLRPDSVYLEYGYCYRLDEEHGERSSFPLPIRMLCGKTVPSRMKNFLAPRTSWPPARGMSWWTN